jgi:hypothetical protein
MGPHPVEAGIGDEAHRTSRFCNHWWTTPA